MNTYQIKVNQFDGGISDDVLEQSNGVFAESRMFDVFSRKHQLIPFPSFQDYKTVDGGKDLTDYSPTLLAQIKTGERDRKLFCLAETGTNVTQVMETTRFVNAWSLSATGTGTVGTRNTDCFIHYHDALYGWRDSQHVWEHGGLETNPSARTFDNTASSVASAYGNACQGVVGIDDALYMPYDNKLLKNDNGVYDTNTLAVPSDKYISSVDNWTKYLAIAAKPKIAEVGRSNLFTYDFSSDDVTDVVDWGEGNLEVVGNLNNSIIGVSEVNRGGDRNGWVMVKAWDGGSVKTIKEIELTGRGTLTNYNVKGLRQITDGRMLFAIDDGTTSSKHTGIWVVKKTTSGFSVAMEKRINPCWDLYGFRSVSGLMHMTGIINGTDYFSKQQTATTYSDTSTWISQRYAGNYHGVENEFLRGYVAFPALSSGEKVKVEYRLNSTSSTAWTLMDSVTGGGGSLIDFTRATGGNVGSFYNIQFKLTSTGGARINELYCKFNELTPSA